MNFILSLFQFEHTKTTCLNLATVEGPVLCDSWLAAFVLHQLPSVVGLSFGQTLLRKHLQMLIITGAEEEEVAWWDQIVGPGFSWPHSSVGSWSPCVCPDRTFVWGCFSQSEQWWHSAETALTYHTWIFFSFVFFLFVCCFFLKKK